MSYPINPAENEFAIPAGSQFDVKKFIYKIIGVLPWFIVSIVLCIIASKIYLRYTMPVSKISAFLLIKSQEEGGNSDYKTLK
jgi:tyrosine-protein kinase Etk/Wzc